VAGRFRAAAIQRGMVHKLFFLQKFDEREMRAAAPSAAAGAINHVIQGEGGLIAAAVVVYRNVFIL